MMRRLALSLAILGAIGFASAMRVVATGALTVTFPNGGETLWCGYMYKLTWTDSRGDLAPDEVQISVYSPANKFWLGPVLVENSGEYWWTATSGIDRNDVKFKVEDDPAGLPPFEVVACLCCAWAG